MRFYNSAFTAGELFAKAKTYFAQSGQTMMQASNDMLHSLQPYLEAMADSDKPIERYFYFDRGTSGLLNYLVKVSPEIAKKIFSIFKANPTFTSTNKRYYVVYSTDDFDHPTATTWEDVEILLSQVQITSGGSSGAKMNDALLFRRTISSNHYEYYVSPVLRPLKDDGSLYDFPMWHVNFDYTDPNYDDNIIMRSLCLAIGSTANSDTDRKVDLNEYFSLGYTLSQLNAMSNTEFTQLLLTFVDGGYDDLNVRVRRVVRAAFFNELGLPLRTLTQYLLRSATLNTNLSKIIGYCANQDTTGLNDFLNSSKLLSEITNLEDNQFYDELSDSLQTAGISGVATTIASILKSFTTVTSDGNGKYGFTDNASLVPQIFLVGIIENAVTVIGTVVSTIVTIYSRVAGIISYLAFGLITKIISWVSGSYDDLTLARIDSKAPIFAYPNAIYKGTKAMESVSSVDHEFYEYMMANQACIQVIPGGIILWWVNNEDDVLCYEVHVTPVHPDIAKALLKDLSDNSYIGSYTVSADTHYYFRSSSTAVLQFEDSISSYMGQNMGMVSSLLFSDCTNEELDKNLRKCYTGGFILSILYLLSTVYFQYSQVVQPWKSDGTSNLGNTDLSAGLDKLLYVVHDPYNTNQDVWNSVTWREILGADDNHSKMFRLLDYYWQSVDAIPYYRSSTPSTFGNTFVERMHGLNSLFADDDDSMDSLPTPLTVTPYCGIVIPKYDRDTYWASVIGAAIATAAIVAVTVIAVRTVKRSIASWNAKWRAKAEASWNTYLENPTTENFNAYYKSVKTNNLLTSITGGTKLSKSSYWDDASTSNRNPAVPKQSVTLPEDLSTKISTILETVTDDDVKVDQIIALIKGS